MTDEEYQIMRADLKNTTAKLSHRDDIRLVQNDYTGNVGDYVYNRLMTEALLSSAAQAVPAESSQNARTGDPVPASSASL